MARLMVITTPDLAPGYRLAGVETFAVEDGEAAERVLRDLVIGGAASLIAVRQDLLAGLDPHLRRQIEASAQPIVVSLPVVSGAGAVVGRRERVTEMIRRAVGFHITLGHGASPPDSR